MGMVVDISENGREGIERIAKAHYDAVVLDLLMPGIDGFGVLEYLDRCKPELLAHTIISSGLPEKYRERVAHYGVCGVVPKPLDHRALQELLARCIADARAEHGTKQANGS
jgi:CheY-like chemotaxis protein